MNFTIHFNNYSWFLISIKHISVFGLLIIVYSLTTLIPAAIISTLENRDFFESWYFATTTISTVGFGDFKLRYATVFNKWYLNKDVYEDMRGFDVHLDDFSRVECFLKITIINQYSAYFFIRVRPHTIFFKNTRSYSDPCFNTVLTIRRYIFRYHKNVIKVISVESASQRGFFGSLLQYFSKWLPLLLFM